MPLTIPDSLWSDLMLRVPPDLDGHYTNSIDALGLRELALQEESGAVGGADAESASDHYAGRFGASSARALAVLLDPLNSLGSVSSDILSSFACESLILVDIACGSGVASLSFLTAIAELRRARVLPSMPLTVVIHGCDFSDWALERFRELHAAVKPSLERVGIESVLELRKSDLRKVIESRGLMEAVEESARASALKKTSVEAIGVIAAISGTAGHPNKAQADAAFEPYRMSVEHIKVRLKRPSWAFVWIEPSMKAGTGLIATVKRMWARISGDRQPTTSTYNWWNSIKGRPARCHVIAIWERFSDE